MTFIISQAIWGINFMVLILLCVKLTYFTGAALHVSVQDSKHPYGPTQFPAFLAVNWNHMPRTDQTVKRSELRNF